MKRLPIALALVVGAAVLALSAWGQQGSRSPILHQDLVPPEPGQGRAGSTDSGPVVFGPEPGEGQNPAAFASGAKILPEPPRDPRPTGSEPVHGRSGFAADRDTQARPDSQTGSDSTLQYVTVFNPSVLPFKRMSAMDAVADDYTLYTSNSTTREDIAVGGAAGSARDLFWGSLLVDLEPGKDVAIPSVAPDMRVLSYEIEPRTSLVFSKNSSDNYYVRSDESGAGGTYRLVFMADADARYFAPEVPRNYRVKDMARRAPPDIIKSLPSHIQEMAERAHQKLGVSPETDLATALDKLIYYFRAFEAKEIAQPSGNLYWDLFINQAGVCRHRSFAFMITANGLGIPTRYLTNEAHAWVEVWLPVQNWVRVDLGGAALRMQVHNAQDKALHQPRGEDPFAQPPQYENNYTQLEGDIDGLSTRQIAERQRGSESSGVVGTDFDLAAPEQTGDRADSDVVVGPGQSLPLLPESVTANKTRTAIGKITTEREGFRGETLPVEGMLHVLGTDRGVGGQRVDVWMAPRGAGGDDAKIVGHTVTRGDGAFSVQVALPDDMELREYELFVSTPGDARFAPSLSE
jgi:transglutaminase-like putative cysteine protease